MCSRADPRSNSCRSGIHQTARLAALLTLLEAVALPAAAAQASAPAAAMVPASAASATVASSMSTTTLDSTRVEAAIKHLRVDPDLHGTEKHRRREFKESHDNKPTAARGRSEFDDFMDWLSDASRVLMWLGGIIIVALVAVLLPRWWRLRGERGIEALPAAPTHVMALDIRPDSLPDDIGAAAATLWQRGEQRAALSLLYRGALSRLVHVDRVPIRAASTEGECVALARPRLPPEAGAYVARLVAAWQQAVYAARELPNDDALSLCTDFAQQLPAVRAAMAGGAIQKAAA